MMSGSQLRLPTQAAPVDRMPAPAALSGGSGMEASAWYDPLVQAGTGILGGLLGGI